MPDPTFLQTPYKWHQRQMVWFGGLPVAPFNNTMPWIDLNDRVSWSCVGSPQIDNTHISNKTSQLAWRGKGVWLAQDFVGRKIRIAMHYDETCGVPFSRAKGLLTQSGEQFLSFDGGLTGLPVRTNSFAESTFLTGAPEAPGQYVHQVELEFLSRDAFARDTTQLHAGSLALVGGNNAFTLPYSGHVFAEPIFNITVPTGQPAISSIYVANQNSGETLAALFVNAAGKAAPLAANVSHFIGLDSSLLQITADGNVYPPNGSFPYVYPNPASPGVPAVNSFVVTLNGGTFSGVVCDIYYYNQWEI